MFLMSLTNFGEYYNAFPRTEHEYEAKVRIMYTNKIFYTGSQTHIHKEAKAAKECFTSSTH